MSSKNPLILTPVATAQTVPGGILANHNPSAHGFYSDAVLEAVAKYFHTKKITWTLITSQDAVPQLIQTERTFHNLDDIARQIDNARVWSGLHGRHSMHDGDKIGLEVAKRVFANFFRPRRLG